MPPTQTPASNPLPQAAPAAPPTEMLSPDDEQHEEHIKSPVVPSSLTLDDALKLYESAKKYVNTGFRKDWDNYFKVYKGKRVQRNYEGIADPVLRESHTIIETLVANIASGIPKFHFVVTNEEQSIDTEILNEMLDYYMLCNQMGLKNQEWVRDMLMYGTGVLHVTWEEGKPKIENIPLRDFFFDPTSTGLVQTLNPAEYAGYEYLANRDSLEAQEIFDAEKGEWVKRYDLTGIGEDDDADDAGDSTAEMDKAFKDLFNGSTLGEDATDDQIHVIKLYHLPSGRLVEIGNKKKFIYDQPTWCQRKEITRNVTVIVDGKEVATTQKLDEIKPFLPFAILRDYVDSSQFLGSGEMELLFHDAELANDYEAMQVDNNAYQNTPMYWVDPAFADLAPEIETIPGAVYPIPRNAMGALERPQLSTDLDNKQDRILSRMRRSTAADEVVQGGQSGSSRTTATEVSTQLQQSQTRFSTKISNLESEGYAQLALVIFKLVQIFVTKQTAIRIVGKMGVHFKDFDPWEYNGEWEANVKLDTTIKRDQVEVGLKDQAVFEAIKGNPLFDQIEVTRWWVKKKDPNMTDDEFNRMLAPPQQPQPSEAEINAQSDLERAKISAYASIYRWSPAIVQGQIEGHLDLQPDPSHIGDMQVKMHEQANQITEHKNALTEASGSPIPGAEQILNPQPAKKPAGLQTATA
jgi:hypothetical protein